jgi:hypothetical protein
MKRSPSSPRVAALAALLAACSHSGNHPPPDDMGVLLTDADTSVYPPTAIKLTPGDSELDVKDGDSPSVTFMVIATNLQGDYDATAMSRFTLSDDTFGMMNASVFTTDGMKAGKVTVTASLKGAGSSPLVATSTLTIKHRGDYSSGCNACPMLPDPGQAPDCGIKAPTIVYPTSGVLLPPNLNQFDVHFVPASTRHTFEIDLANGTTDVRVRADCGSDSDTLARTTGGCAVHLDASVWHAFAAYNRGGDSLTLTVRETSDGMCATTSSNQPLVWISENDLVGAIYYWKSTIGQITGGDIWKKSFGDNKPEEKLTNGQGRFSCFGCHALSRDGKRMAVNLDDNDSDDEYGDVSSGILDLMTKNFVLQNAYQVPGFQTFNHDHTQYLGSVGNAYGDPAQVRSLPNLNGVSIPANDLYLASGNDMSLAKSFAVAAAPMMKRPTMPDWSVDDGRVVLVVPTVIGNGMGYSRTDDDHVFGGSLFTIQYLGAGKFGVPTPLIESRGENNYYPSFSPDGKFVLFNRVFADKKLANINDCDKMGCPNDSFSNPRARVAILPLEQGAGVVDLERLNGSTANTATPLSNSWPRWSPFVETYKGSKLLWVTFSSTRDFGLRVRNHTPVNGQPMRQCYPPGTPENPGYSQYDQTCQSPQLWMAAIDITMAGEIQNAVDPSYPAFWLPFQDITTHNHTAQWTATSKPTMGPCIMSGGDCRSAPDNCCPPLACLGDGTCGMVVM